MRSFILMGIIFVTSMLYAAEYHVDRDRENTVKFISDAPLEDFEGITDHIDGYVLWQGEKPTENSEFYFEVALETIDTGIGLRNRHMRENYLHTDKYPRAKYEGKIVDIQPDSASGITITVRGDFSIHGQTRPLETRVYIDGLDEDVHVTSGFEVNMEDYDIEVPKLMFMKINEIIEVELDFYMKLINE